MKKYYNVVFWTVFGAAAIAFSALMFNDNVWYDEAYSVAMIRHGFADICRITAEDVHPPGYYFILKILTMPFGYSILSAKLVSVLPLLLTMILGYLKLSDIVNKKAGLMFSIMFAFLPIMTTFSVELRMYGWAALFVTGCGLYAYTASQKGRSFDYTCFMFFGVAAAYTHYFALVSVGIIYVMLMIHCIKKRKCKKFFLASFGTVILYLPWLMSFVMQLADKVENAYWIAPITLSTVLNYFKVWFKCSDVTSVYLCGIAAVALLALVSLVLGNDKRLKWISLCCLLVFVLTNAVGIIASVLVRPVFIERYAIPSMPLLLMSMAIGLSLVRNKALSVFVTIFFALGFVINCPDAYNTEYNASEGVFEEMLESGDYEALICCVDSHLYGVLSHYAPEGTNVYRPKLSKGSPFDNIKALSELDTENTKWAALFMPAGVNPPEEIINGYNVEYVRDVTTYGIVCNMYNLWK